MSNISPSIGPQSYPVLQMITVIARRRLILFDSLRPEGGEFEDITGRELFLFGQDGAPIWQVSAESGEVDTSTMQFDRSKLSRSPFVYLVPSTNRYFARRFNGDTFMIDLESGVATFDHWSK